MLSLPRNISFVDSRRWIIRVSLLCLCYVTPMVQANAVPAITASEDGQIVFAITKGQIFASQDGGNSWEMRMQGLSCAEQGEECGKPEQLMLLASPNYNTDQTVLFGSAKHGLLKSSNGGSDWEALGKGQFTPCLGKGRVALSPDFGKNATSAMLVVGKARSGKEQGKYQLYRSEDGGSSFSTTDLGALDGCAALYGTTSSTFFLGTNKGELLVSVDAGLSWKPENALFKAGEPIDRITGIFQRRKQHLFSSGEEDVSELFLMTAHSVFGVWLTQIESEIKLQKTQTLMRQRKEGSDGEIFTNMAVHYQRGNIPSALANLFVMSSKASAPDQPPLLVSKDTGSHWFKIPADSLLPYKEKAGEEEGTSHELSLDPFLDAWGVSGQSTLFLGTHQGLFKSDDQGVSWTLLDMISGWITNVALGVGGRIVGGASGEGKFFIVDYCTLAQGCFGNRLQLTTDKTKYSFEKRQERMRTPLLWEKGGEMEPVEISAATFHNPVLHHELVAMSVDHEKDGSVFRSTARPNNIRRLEISHDNFDEDHLYSILPAIDETKPTFIRHIEFSPNFYDDSTMFVAGDNIGLAVSSNKGETFKLKWNPRTQKPGSIITSIAVSPYFGIDGSMAVLVQDGHNEDVDIFWSQNRGRTWDRMDTRRGPWTQVEAVANDEKAFVLMGVMAGNARLHIWGNTGNVCHDLKNGDVAGYEDGYELRGAVAAPNGDLLAALRQGGVVRFSNLKNVTANNSKDWYFDRKVLSKQEEGGGPTLKILSPYEQPVGRLIAYSPDYKNDQIVVAASYYSIFASYDMGENWELVATLPHENEGRKPIVPKTETHEFELPPPSYAESGSGMVAIQSIAASKIRSIVLIVGSCVGILLFSWYCLFPRKSTLITVPKGFDPSDPRKSLGGREDDDSSDGSGSFQDEPGVRSNTGLSKRKAKSQLKASNVYKV